MRSLSLLLVAVAAAALVMPAAQAQVPGNALEVQVGQVTVPYNGTAPLPVTLHTGCQLILQAGSASPKITASLVSPPPYLSADPVTVTIDPSKCVGKEEQDLDATLTLKVTKDAPGVVPLTAVVKASIPQAGGSPKESSQSGTFNVTYHPAYTITPSLAFPYTMTKRSVEFDLTATVSANARSMIMFVTPQASTGHVTGFASKVYEPGQTQVFRINFTAPDGAWTEAHVRFHTYTHFLLNGTNMAGLEQLPQDVDWVFKNGGVPAQSSSSTTTSTSSPMPEAPGLALMLLAAGAIALRRRQA